ncbi:hypothetical protein OGAPHI_000306 [Ogataea philodendri]|uniref:Uncharacterized protein n=1 Tax=Ogataea philodendri TaxID=1378263 RepID=A0A9P8PG35_9ASCO|nr:uncharacterized protein OGAPHI_000306 [Ogataea philodendri]KAH3671603.1 hypothetical protein OGAPHI_000306 [Ogataea philodendri]
MIPSILLISMMLRVTFKLSGPSSYIGSGNGTLMSSSWIATGRPKLIEINRSILNTAQKRRCLISIWVELIFLASTSLILRFNPRETASRVSTPTIDHEYRPLGSKKEYIPSNTKERTLDTSWKETAEVSKLMDLDENILE